MPDAFGFETPAEAQARLRQRFQESQVLYAKTAPAGSTGAQAGLALSQIFAPTAAKWLDTRAARASETERLVAQTGMSKAEARELSKQNVGRDFAEVRKAKTLQKATSVAQEEMDRLRPLVGDTMANVAGSFMVAGELRKLGMFNEANALSTRATEMRDAYESQQREKQQALADLKATDASRIRTERETERLGQPDILDLSNKREELLAVIDTSDDPAKVAAAERALVDVEANIMKKNFLGFGATDQDMDRLGLQRPVLTGLQNSLIDSGNQLDLLQTIGDTYRPEFLTYGGQIMNWAAVIAEKGVGDWLPEGAQQYVEDFAEFRRNSFDGLNRYIKLITGAQMSEAEATRLRKAFPDPENDSPSQFVAKYKAVTKQIMAVRRRAEYALQTGNLTMLPADMDEGFGADLSRFEPTDEEVSKFLKLPGDAAAKPKVVIGQPRRAGQ